MPEPRTEVGAQPGRKGRIPLVRPRLGQQARTAGLVVLSVAAAAILLARLLPAVGGPALAIAIAVAARSVYTPGPGAKSTLRFASRSVLQAAIVILGATLGLGRIASVGRSSLPLMVATLGIGLLAAAVIGRLLNVQSPLRILIGVGTAICGASAIAAVSSVIAATETEVAYAISTIFAFNVVAVITYPALGHVLGLSQHSFGLWAGTAINDTSSVVAAAYAYGKAAGTVAVVTKLARTTMIVPIVGVLAFSAGHAKRPRRSAVRYGVPPFMIGFACTSALNTAGALPTSLERNLPATAAAMITIALAAIGLSTPFGALRRTGLRPLILGAALWAVVGLSSLLLEQVL